MPNPNPLFTNLNLIEGNGDGSSGPLIDASPASPMQDAQVVPVNGPVPATRSAKPKPGGYAGGALNPFNAWRWLLTGDPNAADQDYQAAQVAMGSQVDENLVPIASAAAEGLRTGAKAVGNGTAQAGVDLLSLGLHEGKVEVFPVTDLDRAYGYDISAALARGGVTVIMAAGTGGLQSEGKGHG